MRVQLTVRGMDRVEAQLRLLAVQFEREAMAALREEAELEMTEAKRRTPVDTGALRASGHVESGSGMTSLASFDTATRKGTMGASGGGRKDLSVRLVFGGPAASYALAVHENLEAHHNPGQAKYLESALLESRPYFAARVGRRMRQLVARR